MKVLTISSQYVRRLIFMVPDFQYGYFYTLIKRSMNFNSSTNMRTTSLTEKWNISCRILCGPLHTNLCFKNRKCCWFDLRPYYYNFDQNEPPHKRAPFKLSYRDTKQFESIFSPENQRQPCSLRKWPYVYMEMPEDVTLAFVNLLVL